MGADSLAEIFADLPPESIIRDSTVIDQRYRRNVTALIRLVPLVLRPANEREVSSIIERANRHRIALYPFSVGKNWGLGSKLPVIDGGVLVDLSRLSRIIEVNEIGRYAVLEPGVSQSQLASYLAENHPSLTFNITGAFAGTSIVGNVLERGDGQRARIDELLGVAGFLGDGTPFSVGGHCGSSPKATSNFASRYSAGPDLVGMFSQANFGIITKMAFRLLPKPEKRIVIWGAADTRQLENVVSRLGYLGDQRTFDIANLNLGYANRFVRSSATMVGKPVASAGETEWQFYLVVDGMASVANIARDVILDRLQDCCTLGWCEAITRAQLLAALPHFLHPLAGPLVGVPDGESIKLIYGLVGQPLPASDRELDVDRTPFGMKCCIPFIPFQADCVRQAADIVGRVREETSLNIKSSFYGDGRSLITVHFRTDDRDQVQIAERAESLLLDRMSAAGYLPYRLAINQMEHGIAQRLDYFRLVSRLKNILDPNGVISPGRYCPVTIPEVDG